MSHPRGLAVAFLVLRARIDTCVLLALGPRHGSFLWVRMTGYQLDQRFDASIRQTGLQLIDAALKQQNEVLATLIKNNERIITSCSGSED